MPKDLYIIDGHAYIYCLLCPYEPATDKPGWRADQGHIHIHHHLTQPAPPYSACTTLLSLIERKSPDMLVVAMDSKTPSFRSEIYPEYKAHRPPMPDDLPVQIDRIEQVLDEHVFTYDIKKDVRTDAESMLADMKVTPASSSTLSPFRAIRLTMCPAWRTSAP